MNDDEFVGDFVYLCETSGLDPKDGLEILNSQDWEPEEEYVTMPAPITIHEDFV